MTTPEIPNNMLETPASISGQLLQKLTDLRDYFIDNFADMLWSLLVCIAILLLAKLVLYLVSNITRSVMNNEKYHRTEQMGKYTNTMMTLLRSVARYAIYGIAIILMLQQFNLFKDLKGLVVTAGIGSLAIGFGAQNLVKDVVTGLFMMFENQFSVGDYIKTEDAEGTVEATAMRVTYLRTFEGKQVIIPNGSISRVINYSRGNNVAIITISTAYEADTRAVIDLIGRAALQYAKENPDIVIEEPVVQGITKFSASSVDIGVICKVHSMMQWRAERGMRLAVKEMFDRCGIEFPYPHMVTIPYEARSGGEGIGSQERGPVAAAASPEWANAEDD